LFRNDDPSSERQIPVEPRVPDSASVEFHADLQIPIFRFLAHGAELEARAVEMADREADCGRSARLGGEGESNDGGLVSGVEVLSARLEGRQVGAFRDELEFGRLQSSSEVRNSLEGGWRRCDEGTESDSQPNTLRRSTRPDLSSLGRVDGRSGR